MRKLLATAVALGPLCVASGAMAETVISNTRTTPIATATATSTSTPDNVRIATNGTVNVTTGAAVTLNSNNTVSNEGTIKFEAAPSGVTGILVVGGNTGSVTNTGAINIADDLATADADNDGDDDGVFAHGTDRAGIRLATGGAFTGNITNGSGGAITLDGNQSYGIVLQQQLIGNLSNLGVIRVVGDGSYGIRSTAAVTGLVTVRGSDFVTGQDSVALSLEGNVSGRVTLGGNITASGYRYTSRPPTQDATDKLDADDLLQGGSAVVIAANMAGGVLIDAAVADKDTNNNDEDADGVTDTEQTAGVITSYGAAPGMRIGSSTQSVTLGAVGSAAAYNYGMVVKGIVAGIGVYDGVNATGLVIGDPLAGAIGHTTQSVVVTNGLRNTGDISATTVSVKPALGGNATAIIIGDGASVPKIQNEGSIRAVAVTDANKNSIAVLIGAGANVTTLTNGKGATISATVQGENASAWGVIDQSGTLTSITNSGYIVTTIVPTDDALDTEDTNTDPSDEVIHGSAIAFDLRANTTGVTLTQVGVNDGDDGADSVADPDVDADGVDDADEPLINGAILLGSGADTLNIQNGLVVGRVSTGAGADVLNISGGGYVQGPLLDSDGNLAINVTNGTLEVKNAFYTSGNCTDLAIANCRTVEASSLNVGADGNLVVTFNPQANLAAFDISGTATLATGAGLGVRFTNLITAPTRFVVVQAGTLNAGTLDLTSLTTNTPYLFVSQLGQNTNQLFVDVRRRTATEAGMIADEAAAYDSVYAALGTDSAIRDAFLAQTSRAGFFNLFEQLLPDHSGAPVLSLASGVDAVSRALADRRPEAEAGEITGWVQEINFYADKDKGDAYGFRSDGFGIASGIEKQVGGIGALGVSLAFTSSDMKDPEAEGDENLTADLIEFGGYWRASNYNWRSWARVAGGYGSFDSTRQFIGGGVNRKNTSSWNGYSLAAGGGIAYEQTWGRFFVRPELSAEYFSLREDAHDENGGGLSGSPTANAFDLAIAERNSRLFRASAMLSVGGKFGDQGWLQPEVRIGYRSNITADVDDTVACFRSLAANDPNRCFTLVADDIAGSGPVFGFRLMAAGQMGYLALEGDAELLDMYDRYSLMIRAGYRF